ncbi:MAG: hypothetical protein QMD14_02945 [Candidatus Aenigmarchaeota archaeon]|nr:hypothetical protein [Candidatus Aenigmarchaeota archaeon]
MGERKAILVSFSIRCGKCESSERNRFFKTLYGWEQRIPSEKKTYIYRREGLLDEIPHIKVDQSSFIIHENEFDRMFKFFEEWTDKVIWKTFKILLEEDEWEEFFKV